MGDGGCHGGVPDPAQPHGPPFLPLPPLPPRGAAQSKREEGKNSAAATARPGPGPGRERPCTAHHTASGTGTSQNSRGWGVGLGVVQPPCSHGEGPSQRLVGPLGQHSLHPPPAPWEGDGAVGAPQDPPISGLAPQLKGGDARSQDFRDPLTASPSSLEPGSSLLPPLLPLHHPICQRSSPSGRGGRGCSPGVTAGRPGVPGAPGEQRGEDGGSGRCRPLPAAQHLFPEHHLTIMLFSSCFFSCRFHMGNLLKVLTYNELDQGPNFFLDFESEMGFLFSFFVSYLF